VVAVTVDIDDDEKLSVIAVIHHLSYPVQPFPVYLIAAAVIDLAEKGNGYPDGTEASLRNSVHHCLGSPRVAPYSLIGSSSPVCFKGVSIIPPCPILSAISSAATLNSLSFFIRHIPPCCRGKLHIL